MIWNKQFCLIGKKRVMAIRGISKALSYMHHDCTQPIIHRDISSNNVLLDLEWVAHVSDFDTARVLKPDSSNWASFAGTFGYIEPGTLKQRLVTLPSFGVLTLEILMGKHPGDLLITSLVDRQEISLTEILDQRLDLPVQETAEQVMLLVNIAFSCLQQTPASRPSMRAVYLDVSNPASEGEAYCILFLSIRRMKIIKMDYVAVYATAQVNQ
ncbi:MDIS1-interacting receptor like kinase 2-like [Rutidosis leptorrhynchoides]|uniref:MDIS1-interacting receptor like kinase 2-like n=1 Tax=Rutidosis leptorrhynchoides TaxID=125765 RepID=UPI003A99800E